MKQLKNASCLVVSLVAFASTTVAGGGSSPPPDDPACGASCCYTVPDLDASGDNFYGPANWDWCRQDFLNSQADGYGMTKDWWDGGFGWDEACDITKPFARTLMARVALQTAPVDPPTDFRDWNGPILRWAAGWAWERVDDLRADCFDGLGDATRSGGSITLHVLGKPASDGTSVMGFFHKGSVMSRAALLLHEARHFQFGSHKGANQRDRSWTDDGPYTWQAEWLRQYAAAANPATSTLALRCSAQDSSIGIMYGDAPDGLSGDGWAFETFPDPNLRSDVADCR